MFYTSISADCRTHLRGRGVPYDIITINEQLVSAKESISAFTSTSWLYLEFNSFISYIMLFKSSISTFVLVARSLLPTTNANNLLDTQSRIIGGSKADSNRYPYTVALTTTGSNFFCGGSLIAPDMVLTAAHCLRGEGISYKVAVGKAHLTKDDGEVIRVVKEIKHPQYTRSTDSFDLGLLVLKNLYYRQLCRCQGWRAAVIRRSMCC